MNCICQAFQSLKIASVIIGLICLLCQPLSGPLKVWGDWAGKAFRWSGCSSSNSISVRICWKWLTQWMQPAGNCSTPSGRWVWVGVEPKHIRITTHRLTWSRLVCDASWGKPSGGFPSREVIPLWMLDSHAGLGVSVGRGTVVSGRVLEYFSTLASAFSPREMEINGWINVLQYCKKRLRWSVLHRYLHIKLITALVSIIYKL